ncbi:MAG: MOSC domain-containing protein, partial [Nitrososphaeraceae archaeon]
MPSHTFFDIAVIHIMTTSTIVRLRELYPEGRFEVRRFRPNLVVESALSSSSGEKEREKKKDFIENSWVGKKLKIGEDNIVLKVIAPCTRCVMITLPQGDLPKDLGILRTVAQYNRVTAGVYATVHGGGGTIRRRDQVILEE